MHYFTAFVKAAFRAHAVWHAWLLAIRTGGSLRLPQSIMCAALTRPGLRMATFWIWHNNNSRNKVMSDE